MSASIRFVCASLALLWTAGCNSSLAVTDGAAVDGGSVSDSSVEAGPTADVVRDAPTDRGALSDGGALLAGHFAPCGVVGFARIQRAVATPDGALVALATRGREVVLVSPEDGSIALRVEAHAGVVHDVVFSDDGAVMFTYGDDGYVRAWQTRDGAPLWATRRSGVAADARMAFRDGVVALGGRPVQLFDARTGASLQTIDDPSMGSSVGLAPAVVAISPDGSTLAVAWGSIARTYTRDGRATGVTLSGDLGALAPGAYAPEIQSLAYSPDGSALLMAVRRAYVVSPGSVPFPIARIFSAADGATIATLTSATSYGVSAAFSRDARHVATAAGGVVEWWTVRDPNGWIAAPSPPRRTRAAASEVRVDARGRILASTPLALQVLAPDGGDVMAELVAGDADGRTLAFTPDGSRILRSTARDTALELWSASPAPRRLEALTVERPVADLSPDGSLLAVARARGVELRSLAGAMASRVVAEEVALPSAVSFAPDGRSIALATTPARSGDVSVVSQWTTDGALVARADAVGPVVQLRRASQGDAWIAVGPSRDRYRGPQGVDLFATGPSLASRFRVTVEGSGIDSADVSADASTVLFAGWITDLRRARLSDGTDVPITPAVRAARVAFSPDGELLVRSYLNTVMVTSPERPASGVELTPRCDRAGCVGPAGDVVRLVFSRDGRTLATVTATGDTRLYCRPTR